MLLLHIVLLAAPAHAERPPGERIADSLVVDVTDEGFEAIGGAVPTLVPDSFDIPDIAQSGRALFRWDLTVTGLFAEADLNRASLRPETGYLAIDGDAIVRVNAPDRTARVRFVYHTWPSSITLADCNVYVRPVGVDASTRAYIWTEDNEHGQREFAASVDRIDWDWTLRGSDIQVSGCFIGGIESILDIVGLSLFDLVVSPIESAVDDQIQELAADLGDQLADAFNSFRLDETFDFNGATLSVMLEPEDVEILPEGMRLTLAGSSAADEHPCVAEHGITGSHRSRAPIPTLGSTPDGIESFHLGILANDDFINQALFSVYRSGAMCFDLEGEQGGIDLNTNMLGLLAPGAFDDLFPERRPIKIELRPTRPPQATAAGDYDFTVDASALKLDVYGELDGRQTSLIGVDLDIEAGMDLRFDGETGALALDLDLGSDNLTARSRPNEIAPGSEEAISNRIGGLFDTMAAPLLGDALSGLQFNIPAFGGFGLASLDVAAAGSTREWLGAYASTGAVPYGGGCGDSGGCDDGSDGCGEGCSPLAGSGRGLTLILLPLIVAALRRRKA